MAHLAQALGRAAILAKDQPTGDAYVVYQVKAAEDAYIVRHASERVALWTEVARAVSLGRSADAVEVRFSCFV